MLCLNIGDTIYRLTTPHSCSREIIPRDNFMSQAFYLPNFQVAPVQLDGFIGDTDRGGSCNVNQISFTPHNLTHIETAAHIIKSGPTVKDIPIQTMHGICQVIDLSDAEFPDNYIHPDHIKSQLLDHSIQILAIKTPASIIPADHDFSGTDPLSLHPTTGKYLSEHHPDIKLLIVDLPSVDQEDDGGKLLAHRYFLEIEGNSTSKRKAIIELAYFSEIKSSGRYYAIITPARVDLDAMITDVVLFDLTK